MSFSNSVLFKATDVGRTNREEHRSERWARGSWLRMEREEQTGILY